MPKALLNLLALERRGTRALGPGLRYALWTQGCPFACPGCVTPEGRPVEPAQVVEVEALAADIVANGLISGVTISGGEPFLQARSLDCLLKLVKERRPELDVIVFTGFLRENLRSEEALSVLARTDLLVDGPYVAELNDGKGLRGSSNQRLHFLTDRLVRHREELLSGKRQVEVRFNGGVTDVIGIPLKG